MKKIIAMLAIGLGVGAFAPTASAQCNSPFCGGQPPTDGPFSRMFYKRPVPAFQAAPWYLYWPYQGHFMTPAPLPGAGYGPPGAGPLVNPYFPSGGVPQAMPGQYVGQ